MLFLQLRTLQLYLPLTQNYKLTSLLNGAYREGLFSEFSGLLETLNDTWSVLADRVSIHVSQFRPNIDLAWTEKSASSVLQSVSSIDTCLVYFLFSKRWFDVHFKFSGLCIWYENSYQFLIFWVFSISFDNSHVNTQLQEICNRTCGVHPMTSMS